jgi:hypothetical protein
MKRRTFLTAAVAALSTPFGLWKARPRTKPLETAVTSKADSFIEFQLGQELRPSMPLAAAVHFPKQLSYAEGITVHNTFGLFYGKPGTRGMAAWTEERRRYEIVFLELPFSGTLVTTDTRTGVETYREVWVDGNRIS